MGLSRRGLPWVAWPAFLGVTIVCPRAFTDLKAGRDDPRLSCGRADRDRASPARRLRAGWARRRNRDQGISPRRGDTELLSPSPAAPGPTLHARQASPVAQSFPDREDCRTRHAARSARSGPLGQSARKCHDRRPLPAAWVHPTLDCARAGHAARRSPQAVPARVPSRHDHRGSGGSRGCDRQVHAVSNPQ